MRKCELFEDCREMKDALEGMDRTISSLERCFCYGEPDRCARYMVYTASEKAAIPNDLFPRDKTKAKQIIFTGEISEQCTSHPVFAGVNEGI